MASNTRKTAFARVPRTPLTAPNQKFDSAIRVDRKFIDNLGRAQLSPEMSTVLARTESNLSVEIQQNGRGNATIKHKEKVVADSSDVQKINALGSFINDERKAVLKQSVAGRAQRNFAAMIELAKDTNHRGIFPNEIQNLSQGFVDVYRTVKAQVDVLNANAEQITALPAEGEADKKVRTHLIESVNRIRAATGEFLAYKATEAEGATDKRRLNDFLLQRNVMSWVFTRLTSQKIQLNTKDFAYRRFYFPRDPTKGLALTYCELQKRNFVNYQTGVLDGMYMFQHLLTNEFVRSFIQAPDEWDLEAFDMESPSRVLKSVPIMVSPFAGAVSQLEMIQALARTNDRGFPWNTGMTSKPEELLKFLGTLPKRCFYASIPRPILKGSLLKRMFPGFELQKMTDEDVNKGAWGQLFDYVNKQDVVSNSWVNTVIRADSEAGKRLLADVVVLLLEITDEALTITVRENLRLAKRDFGHGESTEPTNLWTLLDSRVTTLSQTQANEILAGILAYGSGQKKLKDKDSVKSARSLLTETSGLLVKTLKEKGYQLLSIRIEGWLRSFLSEHIQSEVAYVILAKLDASLAHPINFSVEDKLSFMEKASFEEDIEDEEKFEEAEALPTNPDEE